MAPRAVTNPGLLADQLDQIRREGYADIAEVDEISARIRGRLTDAVVPDAVDAATKAAFADLVTTCGGQVLMAVRSSVTAEDPPDASFAGQQDTYLWLNGYAAVTEHIRRCWASLYTSRAIIYRLKNGMFCRISTIPRTSSNGSVRSSTVTTPARLPSVSKTHWSVMPIASGASTGPESHCPRPGSIWIWPPTPTSCREIIPELITEAAVTMAEADLRRQRDLLRTEDIR